MVDKKKQELLSCFYNLKKNLDSPYMKKDKCMRLNYEEVSIIVEGLSLLNDVDTSILEEAYNTYRKEIEERVAQMEQEYNKEPDTFEDYDVDLYCSECGEDRVNEFETGEMKANGKEITCKTCGRKTHMNKKDFYEVYMGGSRTE